VSLNIVQGSVLDFSLSSSPHDSSLRVGAIVNAANERCIRGGGVDGAINNAGGPNLWKDREALPLLSKEGKRCHTGGAVVTGPGRYGNLSVNYVVHAVGPAYDGDYSDENESGRDVNESEEFAKPDALLRSAYQESLECCREKGITDVAFSLLSSGVFRGKRSLNDVLAIGVIAIRDWVTEQEKIDSIPTNNGNGEIKVPSSSHRLQSITLCGYSKTEVNALIKVCRIIFEDNYCNQNEREERDPVLDNPPKCKSTAEENSPEKLSEE